MKERAGVPNPGVVAVGVPNVDAPGVPNPKVPAAEPATGVPKVAAGAPLGAGVLKEGAPVVPKVDPNPVGAGVAGVPKVVGAVPKVVPKALVVEVLGVAPKVAPAAGEANVDVAAGVPKEGVAVLVGVEPNPPKEGVVVPEY